MADPINDLSPRAGSKSLGWDFRRVLWTVLKYGISALCLVYVFWDVPLTELWAVLQHYPIPSMFGVLVVSFVAYAGAGLRLSHMTRPPLSFRSTFCATLVGLAVNNVLPAKAGEIAKAVWLGRSNGVSSQKTLGIVFMERFFDVNVLALLSLWFLWTMGRQGAAVLFVGCLSGGWCILILFHRYPSLAERFTRLFGSGGLYRFVSQALAGVLENLSPGRLAWLALTSLIIWGIYSFETALSINAVAGLGMKWNAALSVFAISSLAMLLPSSPGALGVYEAFMVTALKHYGVAPDVALALALFSHMIQFIPVTLVGGVIFAAFPAKAAKNAG